VRKYFIKTDDGLLCLLCRNNCVLKEGDVGRCLVRRVVDNEIVFTDYGKLITIVADPIEKKPIYHFRPGAKLLSIGGYACFLRCEFCQNFEISQNRKDLKNTFFSPSAIVELAIKKKCSGICGSFNEPTTHYEYMMDLSEKCHKAGLFFALKTNGFLEHPPWSDICKATDVMNIDYKGSSERFASIAHVDKSASSHVISNIIHAIEHCHVEVSIPIFFDSKESEFTDFVSIFAPFFLKSSFPIHLIKIFPAHNYNHSAVDDDIIFRIRDFFASVFPYVYVHNIFCEKGRSYRSTYCHSCGKMIASRSSFKTELFLGDDCCKHCKEVFSI